MEKAIEEIDKLYEELLQKFQEDYEDGADEEARVVQSQLLILFILKRRILGV